MRQAAGLIALDTRRQGLIEITPHLLAFVRDNPVRTGLLTVFCRHSSASLLIQENADPTAQADLEEFFRRLAPERAGYAHDTEGPDDMPAHLRAALTQTQLSIPVLSGAPALGTWQGVYLFEHRRAPHRRELALHLLGE